MLTILGLWALADHLAPYSDLTDAGCTVGYVYDGDTVELVCGARRETARLLGFDTAETKNPRCDAEKAQGLRATEALRQWVTARAVKLSAHGHDKYGRVLVRMTLDGTDVADLLVTAKLAVYYDGGKRIDWCETVQG